MRGGRAEITTAPSVPAIIVLDLYKDQPIVVTGNAIEQWPSRHGEVECTKDDKHQRYPGGHIECG